MSSLHNFFRSRFKESNKNLWQLPQSTHWKEVTGGWQLLKMKPCHWMGERLRRGGGIFLMFETEGTSNYTYSYVENYRKIDCMFLSSRRIHTLDVWYSCFIENLVKKRQQQFFHLGINRIFWDCRNAPKKSKCYTVPVLQLVWEPVLS